MRGKDKMEEDREGAYEKKGEERRREEGGGRREMREE